MNIADLFLGVGAMFLVAIILVTLFRSDPDDLL